ncbi:MAG: type III pantothenate kinase [Gammaproteobacteria bacterium]|nr:type III pantothenate kinase [Gammaproteobacteria bacterium]
MILLIDVGNSRIKWNAKRSFTGEFVQNTASVPWSHDSLLPLFESQWRSFHGKIKQIYVSNVAGQAMQQSITQWMSGHLGLNTFFMQTQANQLGVECGYQNHRQFGVDRWLAVLAARSQRPKAELIVLGCGTAITIDVVTSQGRHLAGPIIPNKTLMVNALVENTADIHEALNQPTHSLFVGNTQEAIATGACYATAYTIRGIVNDIVEVLSAENSEANIMLVVSGGAAASIMPLTGIADYQTEADIVLQGLALVAASEL